jgi:hypothetical protein
MGRNQTPVQLRCVVRQITGYLALTFLSNNLKVFKWLVKNDGAKFQDTDWKRLTKIGL